MTQYLLIVFRYVVVLYCIVSKKIIFLYTKEIYYISCIFIIVDLIKENKKDQQKKKKNEKRELNKNERQRILAKLNINYGGDIKRDANYKISPLEDFKFLNVTKTLCYLNASLHCVWHAVLSLDQDFIIKLTDILDIFSRYKWYSINKQQAITEMLPHLLDPLKDIACHEICLTDSNIADASNIVYNLNYNRFQSSHNLEATELFWGLKEKVKILFIGNAHIFQYPRMQFENHVLTCKLFIIFYHNILI